MRQKTRVKGSARLPVTRERALSEALALADKEGIGSLTMRRLAHQLGVEAMSLYHHVANKDDILDGIVDLVISEIEVPPKGTDWKTAMRRRAISAHEVLLAHPWAAMLCISRFNIGPGNTRYLNATLGRLREGGFSVVGALDAWNTLDNHIYGFTLQELNLPLDPKETREVSASVADRFSADEFPYVVEVIAHVMESGREEDFAFGLDLILDGLERTLDTSRPVERSRRP